MNEHVEDAGERDDTTHGRVSEKSGVFQKRGSGRETDNPVIIERLSAHLHILDTIVHRKGSDSERGFNREKTKEIQALDDAIYLQCIDRNCSGNVFANKEGMERAFGLPLKIVCGSFGIVTASGKIWWEWGGETSNTVRDFARSRGGDDCHFWLQSDDGKVYDIIQAYVTNLVVPVHAKHLDLSRFGSGCVVDGWSPTELQSIGLVYRPADQDAQKIIVEFARRNLSGRSF